jgi:F-type H+-transporting ATPase subunit a
MVLTVVVSSLLLGLCLRKRSLVPNAAQSVPEGLYEFVSNLLRENIGAEGLKYFPFIFTVFLFLAFGNLLGLFPYSFTFTSHLTSVGCLSLIAFLFNIGIGIKKKKLGWLRTFLPRGIPTALAPVIIPIEMVSFLSKPFSLTMRLVANMTVGHIMLKIIAGFVISLGVLGAVPLLFDSVIICFEMFISVLQAFIYTVLSCIYLGDAIHEH